MKKLLIVWGNWGPYHYARFRTLYDYGRSCGFRVQGLELFPSSGYYDWQTTVDHSAIHHLDLGQIETEFNLGPILSKLFPFLWNFRPHVIFVPSYWHWSLFINATGRLLGAKIVMMNESHSGTERARGLTRTLKKAVVKRFHAALVGGNPHRRHFAKLGLDESVIHLGYDAVDNEHFTNESQAARLDAENLREQFQLPEHYFLNLGRMVKKKNLLLLIQAYALLLKRDPLLPHDLVLVGSGEEIDGLRSFCRQLKLTIVDQTDPQRLQQRVGHRKHLATAGGERTEREEGTTSAIELRTPTVHFYGFRQIHENPIFYALASAFILPSSTEEWGLVVNEAMASGLPVLVSKEAGCAEDLVQEGVNGFTFSPRSAEELTNLLATVADPTVVPSMGENSLQIVRDWGCERFASGAINAAFSALGENFQTDG